MYIGVFPDVEKHIQLNSIHKIIILFQNQLIMVYCGFKDMIIRFMIQLYLMNLQDGLHLQILN